MRCVVLGGGGFLGSHLCEALLSVGHEVRVFDRPELSRVRLRELTAVEWIEGDFANHKDLVNAVEDCNIVYHMVSTTLPKSSNDNPAYDIESNVIGTLQLLDLGRHGAFGKVVFLSSGGTVYGLPQEIPIKESHVTDPLCSYGIGKLAIEKYLSLYHYLYGLDYGILRVANAYGERQRVASAQGVVAVFLGRALRGEVVEIWGDGSVVRDYVYAGDVASSLIKAAVNTGDETLFNIGTGKGHSVNEVLAMIERVIGRPVVRTYRPARGLDVPVNVLDISRARRELGWEPQVAFEEGLARTADWIRCQPA